MTQEQRAILFQRLLLLEVKTYEQTHASSVKTMHLTGNTADAVCDEVKRVLAGVYKYET